MDITKLFHKICRLESELAHLYSLMEQIPSMSHTEDLDKYYEQFYPKIDQTKNLHNNGVQRHEFVRGVRHWQLV